MNLIEKWLQRFMEKRRQLLILIFTPRP